MQKSGDSQDNMQVVYLTTVDNREIGKDPLQDQSQHLTWVSEETNLQTEFGIAPESASSSNTVRFRVNMARPKVQYQVQECPMKDKQCKVLRTMGNTWEHIRNGTGHRALNRHFPRI